VVVDEHDNLVDGRSSSAAKKADALRKVAFERRSSRTSRSSSARRCASDVVVPGRSPASTSTCVTQFRSVSGLIPSCSPTRASAPFLVAGSRRRSTAIRMARSRSSSGYFLGAAMTLILRGLRASMKPGAVQSGSSSAAADWAERDMTLPQNSTSARRGQEAGDFSHDLFVMSGGRAPLALTVWCSGLPERRTLL
jgi:hypothetical protein